MSQPWLKFWVADWRSSSTVRQMSMEDRGYYIEMILADHESDGLPGDWADLRVELPVQAEESRALKILNAHFVEGPDGLWRHPKRVKNAHITRVRSEAGRLGGVSTHAKNQAIARANGKALAGSFAQPQKTEDRRQNTTTIGAVYSAWRAHHSRARPEPSEVVCRVISEALGEWSEGELVEAIEKAHQLPWYRGRNQSKQKFLSLRYLLRPGEVEKILEAEVPADPRARRRRALTESASWGELMLEARRQGLAVNGKMTKAELAARLAGGGGDE